MKRGRLAMTILLGFQLAACGSPISPAEKYEEAISAVEGVESVVVDWQRSGPGDSTGIEVSTDTNEPSKLKGILEDTLHAFAKSTEQGDATGLNYLVYSQDRSLYMTPGDLAPGLRGISDIREYYGLD